jgi:hypothetical protein
MRSKSAIPSLSHATASPSTMQERERSRAKASVINGKPVGQVVTGSAIKLHPRADLAGDNPTAIVLDFVQP